MNKGRRKSAPAEAPLESALQAARRTADELWGSLAGVLQREGCKSVLFTAPERGAGTTVVAAQSVLGLVRNTRTTACLVEASLADPDLAAYLDVRPTPGLAEWLDGSATLDDVAVHAPRCPGLDIVPAGAGREAIPGEFADPDFVKGTSELRSRYEHFFIDAPPLVDHPEARLLLQHVEGVIAVVRARSTSKSGLRALESQLADLGVPLFGVVVNRYRSDLPFGLD